MNIRTMAMLAFAGFMRNAYSDHAQKVVNIKQLVTIMSSMGLPVAASLKVNLEQAGIADSQQQDDIIHAYFENILTAVCLAYDELYTESEISDLLHFFSSPTGLKFSEGSGKMADKIRPAYMTISTLINQAKATHEQDQ